MLKIKTKLNSKITKDKIIDLFYEKHFKPTSIATELNVGKSYITKIIQNDFRYFQEKDTRKKDNKEKNKAQKREYIQRKRAEERQSYLSLLKQIDSDNQYLSTKSKLSILNFVKSNRDMFEYCKNSSDLQLKNGINVGYNVPKRIRNVVNASSIRK